MSRKKGFWLGIGIAGVSGVLLILIWGAVQEQWHRHQALSLYAQGDFRGARQQSEALLNTSPDLPTEGMARVLLAEIALHEQRWEDAENQATTAILRLQQSLHGQSAPDHTWLKRALSARILTGLAPVVNITQDEIALYPWALEKVRPFIENAQGLGESRFDRLLSLPEDAYGLGIWKDFIAREPLYGRLRDVKKITLPVEAKPQNQAAVREVVSRWQAIKAEAFVNQDTEALQTVLTGAALEGSLQAVQWWIDHPDAYYTSLELHALKFLRVSYASGTSATVVAEVEETRNNSQEGLQKQRYQVEYTLVKMGETWLIDRIKVRN
jgi:hypothetical protein